MDNSIVTPKPLKGLVKRNGVWHFSASVSGVRVRKSLKTDDYSEAVIRSSRYRITRKAAAENMTLEMPENWLATRLWAINVRNKEMNTPPMTLAQLTGVYEKSMGVCELTAIPFSFSKHGGRRAPFCPSFDRINNGLGYFPANLRVVCLIANIAMNDWGEGVLDLMCEAYVNAKGA